MKQLNMQNLDDQKKNVLPTELDFHWQDNCEACNYTFTGQGDKNSSMWTSTTSFDMALSWDKI